MSPKPAVYYVALTLHATPDSSLTLPQTHVLVPMLTGPVLWGMTGQCWPTTVGVMTLIAVVAMFRGRRCHGSHLPPSHFLIAGMAAALNLPFTIFLLDLPGPPVGVLVVDTTAVLAAMRVDEKERRRRLATGDSSYHNPW